ncbi:hypothetical protein ACLMJK_000024 [Lecanora helva]
MSEIPTSTWHEDVSSNKVDKKSLRLLNALEREQKALALSQFSTSEIERIKGLCHELWPSRWTATVRPPIQRLQRRLTNAFRVQKSTRHETKPQQDSFVIENMRGGSFNKVAGITAFGPSGRIQRRMVIRAPQAEGSDTEIESRKNVTILRFVQRYTQIPIPNVIMSSPTSENALGRPYIIQHRIPGYDLESEVQPYPSLTHKQKLSFVEQYCSILLQMQQIRHPWVGDIISTDEDETFSVAPFEIHSEPKELMTDRSNVIPFFKVKAYGVSETVASEVDEDIESQDIMYFFKVQFARWRIHDIGLDPSVLWLDNIFHRLYIAASQMNSIGCLECESYCLAHYDLDPRNIMVEIVSGIPKVTGIVDWDLAMFAPNWVSCKPPMWIWNWIDGSNEDESRAGEEPPTTEQRELKRLFDDLVGEDFTYHAYQPHARLARQLFRYARWGLGSCDMWRDEAEKMLEEWGVLFADLSRRIAEKAEKEAADNGGAKSGETDIGRKGEVEEDGDSDGQD